VTCCTQYHYTSHIQMAGLTSDELNVLKERSTKMKEAAYAPYSNFRVGACLMDNNGKLYTGCNVENSSYGLSICAERTAYTKAISEGAARPFKAIAVAADVKDRFIYPCGACRQFGSEFGEHTVILVKPDNSHIVHTTKELLPGGFQPADLLAPKAN